MPNIYLTCRMRVREYPSLSAPVVEIREKNQIIEVTELIPETDGYIWFKIENGYIANVDEVFYHADDYPDTTALNDFIDRWLDMSLISTTKAIEELKKTLDSF